MKASNEMYQRMLLAYDGSKEGRAALREGALLAARHGSDIFLLSIMVLKGGAYLAEGAVCGAISQIEDQYKGILDEGLSHLKAHGFKPRGALASGEPVPVIAEYARKTRADLVIVGHRRQTVQERWWTGNGNYLAEHLDCSLLICRSDLGEEQYRAQMASLLGAPVKA